MKVVCLLSGGQDSTTCLGWAVENYGRESVYSLSFDYGQRHRVELSAAQTIAEYFGVPNYVLPVPALQQLGAASLTAADIAVDGQGDRRNEYADAHGLPQSFVPGRNAVFFATAAGYAAMLGAHVLVTGICQQDYAGYPDCRETFREPMEEALRAALDEPRFRILAPLMYHSKAETWALADDLGIVALVREETHTCYEGDRTGKWNWGYGCGSCGACVERKKGYAEWVTGKVEVR